MLRESNNFYHRWRFLKTFLQLRFSNNVRGSEFQTLKMPPKLADLAPQSPVTRRPLQKQFFRTQAIAEEYTERI